MRGRRRQRARRATAAVVATAMAVVLAAGACSDEEGDDRAQPTLTTPSTTATTAAPTTTTDPEPERVEAEPPPDEPRPDIDVNVTYPAEFDEEQIEVVEAYRGFWHAYYAASDPPDPNHPLLRDFMTIERLEGVQAGLRASQERGVVVRIPDDAAYRHVVTAIEIAGDTALIRDCGVDDAVVVDSKTGELVDSEVVTRDLEIAAERIGSVWRIGGREPRTVQQWQGVAGCAEHLS